MRVLSLVAVLALVSGCERVRVISQQDSGPACPEGEQLVSGQCRFVCERDGDCPAGQRCNLLVGQCVPKPPPVDAGPADVPCTEGAVRCSIDNDAVETCDATGVFVTTQTCPAPEGFCQFEQCLACRPGAVRCGAGGATAERCRADGSGYDTTTCASGSTCVSGECRECDPGQKRCSANGQNLEICQRLPREDLSFGYVPSGDNFDGTCVTRVCEQGPNGAQCRAPLCVPGATQCAPPVGGVSLNQQVCSATGAWTDVACASQPNMGPDAECLYGACVDECGDAARARSYFGCDYWTTVMDNNVLTPAIFMGNLTTAGQGTVDSEFAFVVANNSALPARVVVTRFVGAAVQTVKDQMVPGRNDPATKGVAQIRVPWHRMSTAGSNLGVTGRARHAFRLTSSRPVTVYQFNPLAASRRVGTCNNVNQCNLEPSGSGQRCTGGQCEYFSFSNDASLLLPAHILGTSYVGLTTEHVVRRYDPVFQTGSNSETPVNFVNGTLSIVAPQDNTQVTVRIASRTLAGSGGVAAMSAGETRTFTLQSYEVLQLSSDMPSNVVSGSTTGNLQCDNDPFLVDSTCLFFGDCVRVCRVATGDLTGSVVTSDKPIAMFGGSSCTVRGFANAACDHVEEQLFPFVTWGKNFVAGRTAPLRLTNDQFASAANAGPDYYKIVAGCPDSTCPTGTLVTLSLPPASGDVLSNAGGCEPGTSLTANNCRLRGGRFIEWRSKGSFTITADQPIQVAQIFAGQDATTGSVLPAQGDPSIVLLPPVEQWRATYTVLTAPGTRDNYLGIVADNARVLEVRVDGSPIINGWTTIAGSTFRVVNVPVQVGSHTITVLPRAGQTQLPGAGVTVYGFDSYVSYGYTGGLDLTTIVTGVNPGG